MDSEAKSRRKAWRTQARADLRRPWFWVFIACLYVVTFLIVALLMLALDLIVPHLPWISKPYISSNPPPLATAFYCANLIPISLVVLLPLLYILGGPFKKNTNKKKS
jgi:hypothetical protein